MFAITYTVIAFFILALVVHGCYTIWKIKKHLHILQLNSYFNGRYVGWLNRKKYQVFNLKELEPLIALVGMFFRGPLIVLVIFVLVYFGMFLSRPNLPEKKPFVFTTRAIRLFIVSIGFLLMLYVGLFVIWFKNGDFWLEMAIGLLVACNFFVPFLLMLLNLLLQPLEKLIQNWYFRDAQRYLRTLTKLKIIGITGSFGKTTTKYVLTEILRYKFNTLKTPGSYNTPMGVAKIIRSELKPTHEIFVAEMSAKKSGDIQELCELVQPQYGLITAIGEQHLETFKTLENIKKTKNELIAALPLTGVAFFNMDDVNSLELASAVKCCVIGYGMDAVQLDYRATDIVLNEHGSNFTVIRDRDNSQACFQTKLLGKHNIYNILGAIAVAGELGVSLVDMVHPVRQIAPIPHRLELKRLGNGIVFIDDAFNSNPVGSKMALEVLAQISGKRKIIITPGMIELGEKEGEYNERFGGQIADVCGYVILVGKKQTLPLQQGLKARNYADDALFIAEDFAAARKHLEQILQAGDVVLFENDLPDNYSE